MYLKFKNSNYFVTLQWYNGVYFELSIAVLNIEKRCAKMNIYVATVALLDVQSFSFDMLVETNRALALNETSNRSMNTFKLNSPNKVSNQSDPQIHGENYSCITYQ